VINHRHKVTLAWLKNTPDKPENATPRITQQALKGRVEIGVHRLHQ
jgi:hypothetical protein